MANPTHTWLIWGLGVRYLGSNPELNGWDWTSLKPVDSPVVCRSGGGGEGRRHLGKDPAGVGARGGSPTGHPGEVVPHEEQDQGEL